MKIYCTVWTKNGRRNLGAEQWSDFDITRLHREDGPAVEYINGTKQWYLNGKCHREDGPAIEFSDGYKGWYLDGIYYLEDEYWEEIDQVKSMSKQVRLTDPRRWVRGYK